MSSLLAYMSRGALAVATAAACVGAQAGVQGFINAPGRVDTVYDPTTSVLYISGDDAVRRFDMASGNFLSPWTLGGRTMGMDLSPDGKTLAVANSVRGASSNHVDLIDLATGRVTQRSFALEFAEGGTYAVAFDGAGQLLVTSRFEGSGWTPIRKLDPSTGATTILGTVTQDVMLAASADRSVIGVAEANISDGRWGYYRTGDTTYASQHQWYDPVSGGTSWFNFEIGVSRDGGQFAIPTYGGLFVGDAVQVVPRVGEYAGVSPIGVGYSPTNDEMFLPFANTNVLARYDSGTLTEIDRFEVPGNFDWTGNWGFVEGRTKVAADGSFVFSTLDDGVFFAALSVPEPESYVLMLSGLAAVAGFARRRRR